MIIESRRAMRNKTRETLLHFVRGFISERDGEYVLGTNAAAFDQIGDAVREHTGLAAAGAGQNKYRAGATGNRLALGRVERL